MQWSAPTEGSKTLAEPSIEGVAGVLSTASNLRADLGVSELMDHAVEVIVCPG